MFNRKYYSFERNNYFYGKLLTSKDFQNEQRYTNDKRRLINRTLHGMGIVYGMDVVVADKVCQHDMDTSPLGDPRGLISGINRIFFECDSDAVSVLKKSVETLGLNLVMGTIASGDKFVADAALKADINKEFGAISCEMEGGSIGHVCFVNNMPFAVLRSISDGDGGELDYLTFAAKAADNAGHIMEEFIKNW